MCQPVPALWALLVMAGGGATASRLSREAIRHIQLDDASHEATTAVSSSRCTGRVLKKVRRKGGGKIRSAHLVAQALNGTKYPQGEMAPADHSGSFLEAGDTALLREIRIELGLKLANALSTTRTCTYEWGSSCRCSSRRSCGCAEADEESSVADLMSELPA